MPSTKELRLDKANKGMFAAFYRTIRRVPRGRVATYGDIAYAAGYPGAARQVAWALHACGRDLPWQRIVGAGGRILLTGEFGFEQRMRLQAEGVRFIGLRVDMRAHQHSFFPRKKKARHRGTKTQRKTGKPKSAHHRGTETQRRAGNKSSSRKHRTRKPS